MKNLLFVLFVLGAFLLSGCSTTPQPGPVTEARHLVGTWERFENYHQFNDDGTYRYAGYLEALIDRPFAIGEYWFEDGKYMQSELEVRGVPSCGPEVGIYEVELLENGNLFFTLVEDECASRSRTTSGEYERADLED